MKKLLLVFMSMFFVLGTSMAQDKEEESKDFDFNSPIVRPDSKTPQTSVGQIYLTFSKDVVVTLPESGIPIVNTETNTTILIDSLFVNEWMPKTDVMFMFEQELVADEKGEEWKCKTITAPGTYSYTIPAGCIKSVDGEEFPETTFTFSIVGTFPITNYSPTQTTENINEIVLTFEKEITAVNLPKEYPLTVFNSSWEPAATINEATISEDGKSVTLIPSNPLTIGQYMLSINEGVLTSADGINAYSELYFRVIDPTPRFTTNYQDGDRVKVEEFGDFEITFANVEEVQLLDDSEDPITLFLPGGGDETGTVTLESNKITVSFDQQFTQEGEYMFWIPEGAFTMDGEPNEERIITVDLYKNNIKALEIASVAPESGEVATIEKITIKYNQVVRLSYDGNWQQISKVIYLTSGEEKYPFTLDDSNWNLTDEIIYLAGEYDEGYNFHSAPITAAGSYTLNLADVKVDYASEAGTDEYGYPTTIWNASGSIEKTYTWTITGEASVENIEVADGEQVIYDLLGRRVEKITGAGIYIVNGKKVVIK